MKKTIYTRLNETNHADFGAKTTGEFRRQLDKDITYDKQRSINWDDESAYYNSYYIPKYNIPSDIEIEKRESELLKLNTTQLFNEHRSKLEAITEFVDSAWEKDYSDKYSDAVKNDIAEWNMVLGRMIKS